MLSLSKDACAYKILQDGRFHKIEQENLESTFKISQDQDLCLARLSKIDQDHG
jgi:hypothetical protein